MAEASHYAHSSPQAGKPIFTLVEGAIFLTTDLALTAPRDSIIASSRGTLAAVGRPNETNWERKCQKAPFLANTKSQQL
jgi:hypothetical protein